MAVEAESGFGVNVCPYCSSSTLTDLEGEAGGHGKKCRDCQEKWAITRLEPGETLRKVERR